MLTLIVQIKCELGQAYDVAASIVDDLVGCQIYSVSGSYDLLAIVYLPKSEDPGIFVNKRLHSIPGVKDTCTTIAFNAFNPPGI